MGFTPILVKDGPAFCTAFCTTLVGTTSAPVLAASATGFTTASGITLPVPVEPANCKPSIDDGPVKPYKPPDINPAFKPCSRLPVPKVVTAPIAMPAVCAADKPILAANDCPPEAKNPSGSPVKYMSAAASAIRPSGLFPRSWIPPDMLPIGSARKLIDAP